MKLFGEYLVEKQVITESALVEALVEQLKSMPSVPEVFFSSALLELKKVLDIFRLQHVKKCSFVDGARELNYWSSELEEKLDEELAKKRIPLGQVLVRMNFATLEQITHALDEFLSTQKLISSHEQDKQINLTKEPKPNALNSDLTVFLDLFTDQLKNSLMSVSNSSASIESNAQGFQNACFDLHCVRGAARLVNLEPIEKFLGVVEDLGLELISTIPSDVTKEVLQKFDEVFSGAVEILWEIVSAIKAGQSPTQILETEERGKRFKEISGAAQVLTFDLSLLTKKAA